MNAYYNNCERQQQKDLYSTYGSVPMTNQNIFSTQMTNDNVPAKMINSNVASRGYDLSPTEVNIIHKGYSPANVVPSQMTNVNKIGAQMPIKNIVPVSKKNTNVISTQKMNINEVNIACNLFQKTKPKATYTEYNPIQIENTHLISQDYNPALMPNTNMVLQKQNKIININQMPVIYSPTQNLNPIIVTKGYNPNIKQNEVNTGNNPIQIIIINGITNKSNRIQTNKKDEVKTGNKLVSIDLIVKAQKSICKITFYFNNKRYLGTGFFMKVTDSLKFLITNYHVIAPEFRLKKIQLEIWNKKIINLKLDGCYIKYIEKPRDITAIEIKDLDEINKDIEFLGYDLNYLKDGYKIYNNADIFSIEHPFGQNASYASGSIININGYEFDHNISTSPGSSGSPIILLNNNINLIQVIGIHKSGDEIKGINGGTFIGEIVNEINKDILSEYKSDKLSLNLMKCQKIYSIKTQMENSVKVPKKKVKNITNNIIAEIYIKDDDVNENIRIINSYEKSKRVIIIGFDDSLLKNEEEIKECEIKINDELIPFNYYHIFKNKGKYTIKYTFKNYLTKTNHMFENCSSLISIDLSNFNIQNVNNMEKMFYGCSSLTSIDLSNFNTQNVTNIKYMFYGCSSLTCINLSNINSQNVTYMDSMFSGCSSLTSINLSNINTQNVTYMDNMFKDCSSLTSIDLSNFNTQNVISMEYMFSGCLFLTSIDLSKFNTQKVTNMSGMFYGCSSLLDIDLSNFNTQNVTNMDSMFSGCSSLTHLDLSNFNTKNVINMYSMFHQCSSLSSINLSNFNTQNVIAMDFMFYGCSSLSYINLSNFNTQKVHFMSNMFYGCSFLKKKSVITKDQRIIEECNKRLRNK